MLLLRQWVQPQRKLSRGEHVLRSMARAPGNSTQTQANTGALGQHGGQGKFTIKELPGIH